MNRESNKIFEIYANTKYLCSANSNEEALEIVNRLSNLIDFYGGLAIDIEIEYEIKESKIIGDKVEPTSTKTN